LHPRPEQKRQKEKRKASRKAKASDVRSVLDEISSTLEKTTSEHHRILYPREPPLLQARYGSDDDPISCRKGCDAKSDSSKLNRLSLLSVLSFPWNSGTERISLREKPACEEKAL